MANVLASRYAGERMRALWTPARKVVLERRLWLAVLRAQRALGADVPESAIEDYEAVASTVDLESIAAREAVTRHDVKARIDEFCALAGHQHIHRGMTSRDLTENVEQMQIRESLKVIRDGMAALVAGLADRAEAHSALVMAARTHNVPAQPTTLGKRFADAASEALIGYERIAGLLARYPLRGMKGAVGTRAEQLDLLGSPAAAAEMERLTAEHCGFGRVLPTSAQVYPRSLDLDVVSALVQAVSAPSSLALTLRLMAGHELVSEGFRAGQVGSSAMPHKVNARSCERIGALKVVLDGHLAMAASLAGRQWNEGDVSCSAARRIMLPDAFFAADGLLHTARAVLADMEVFEGAVAAELRRELPLLASGRLLGALAGAGLGRETAHEIIAEHARAVVLSRRSRPGPATRSDRGSGQGKPGESGGEGEGGRGGGLGLLDRLAADPRVPLGRGDLSGLMASPCAFVGTAAEQVAEVVVQARAVASRHPQAAAQQPELRL